MKQINQFITEYIVKKKLDKPIDSEDHYEYFPKTKQELIDNIQELLEKGKTDLNCIDTSKITDMSMLFEVCKEISNIDFDVSKWDVSNVKNMRNMFDECRNFTGKGLENWDVSNVTNMRYMFNNCRNFNSDLSNWDVSNVEDMTCMFYNCKKLNFDLSKWDISKVKDMAVMFYNCNNLKNIPSWYTK